MAIAITNPDRFAQKQHLSQSVEKLYELIKKWGVTPFDKFLVVTQSEAGDETIEKEDGDFIVYHSSHFYLMKHISGYTYKYYQNWKTANLYYNQSAVRTDRLFVSPEGYIINGVEYNPYLDPVTDRLDDLENIVGTDATKGLRKKVADLETTQGTQGTTLSQLGTTVDGHTTSIANITNLLAEGGATSFAEVVSGDINVNLSSAAASGGVIYSKKNGRFYYKTTDGEGNTTYWDNWTGRGEYNTNTGTITARTDRFFVSKDGYLIKGELFNPDFTEVYTELNKKVDKETYNKRVLAVDNALGKKVETSVYQAKVGEIQQHLETLDSGKASTQQLNTLANEVSTKASQSSLDTLSSEIETDLAEVREVFSASLNNINTRLTGTLKRQIVPVLPTSGMDENTIYMVKVAESGVDDYCNEYMWDSANSRYELIGSNRTDLNDYTSNAEQARYIASNQGLPYTISSIKGEGDARKSITLKTGDKIKLQRISGNITSFTLRTYNGTSYVNIASGISLGQEITLAANYDNISIIDASSTTGATALLRVFITNSNLSFELMTESDINEIFSSLS